MGESVPGGKGMTEKSRYFVLKQKAVPEVLLKVVEVKRLLASEKGITVQEATEEAGISRSSYYKYRDDIFPFHDETKGKTVTFMLQMEDEPGLLSKVLNVVAEFRANILRFRERFTWQRMADNFIELFRKVYAEGKADGEFDIEDVDLVADITHYCIKGLEVPFIYGRLGHGMTEEASKPLVAKVVYGALGKNTAK